MIEPKVNQRVYVDELDVFGSVRKIYKPGRPEEKYQYEIVCEYPMMYYVWHTTADRLIDADEMQ